MFSWNSLAFLIIQQMLAIWSLVPLPFLKPAWTSGSSRLDRIEWSKTNFWKISCSTHMSQVYRTPFFTFCLYTCHSFHFQEPPTPMSVWCNTYILRSRSKVRDHGLCEDLCPDLYYITLKQSHAFYFFVLWDLCEHVQRFILVLM